MFRSFPQISSLPYPHFHTLLEGFFPQPTQLRCHSHLDFLHIFKTVPFKEPLELTQVESITQSYQVGEVGLLLQHRDVLLGQKPIRCPGQCEQACCQGKAKWSCSATAPLFSCTELRKCCRLLFLICWPTVKGITCRF